MFVLQPIFTNPVREESIEAKNAGNRIVLEWKSFVFTKFQLKLLRDFVEPATELFQTCYANYFRD